MDSGKKNETIQNKQYKVEKNNINKTFYRLKQAYNLKNRLFKNTQQRKLIIKKNSFSLTCKQRGLGITSILPNAYFYSEKFIGLLKLNRIVQYFTRQAKIQKQLKNQMAKELKIVLNTKDVKVKINTQYLCVSSRGIGDETSSIVTSYFGGKFNNQSKIVELQNT